MFLMCIHILLNNFYENNLKKTKYPNFVVLWDGISVFLQLLFPLRVAVAILMMRDVKLYVFCLLMES